MREIVSHPFISAVNLSNATPTIYIGKEEFINLVITEDHTRWCEAYQYRFGYNEMIVGLLIPSLAFFSLQLYFFILDHSDRIQVLKNDETGKKKKVVLKLLKGFTRWTFLIYFGWIIYQRFWGILKQ